MIPYPPVDPDFYSIGAASGMSDEDIQKDWEAYCDDLAKFHQELDVAMGAPEEVMKAEEPRLDDLQKFFTEPKNE